MWITLFFLLLLLFIQILSMLSTHLYVKYYSEARVSMISALKA